MYKLNNTGVAKLAARPLNNTGVAKLAERPLNNTGVAKLAARPLNNTGVEKLAAVLHGGACGSPASAQQAALLRLS